MSICQGIPYILCRNPQVFTTPQFGKHWSKFSLIGKLVKYVKPYVNEYSECVVKKRRSQYVLKWLTLGYILRITFVSFIDIKSQILNTNNMFYYPQKYLQKAL